MLIAGAVVTLLSYLVRRRLFPVIVNACSLLLMFVMYPLSAYFFAFIVLHTALDFAMERSSIPLMLCAAGVAYILPVIAGVPLQYYPTSHTACRSNLKNLGTALEMYSTDHEGRFPAALSALTPGYLKSLPRCGVRMDGRIRNLNKPLFERVYGRSAVDALYGYEMGAKPDCYTVTCAGGHTGHGNGADRPLSYNSRDGLEE